jgi:hypothetical protein
MAEFGGHGMAPYEAVCAAVVDAMLVVPLTYGVAVQDLIGFDGDIERRASAAADAALKKGEPTSTDVRELVAASVLAYTRDPSAFTVGNPSPAERIAEKIRSSMARGVRNTPPIEDQERSVAANRASDEKRGEELLDQLRRR